MGPLRRMVPLSNHAIEREVIKARDCQSVAQNVGDELRAMFFGDVMDAWLDVLCERGYGV